ncbi:MAG: YfiR family protein [Bacteroidota bacterium]
MKRVFDHTAKRIIVTSMAVVMLFSFRLADNEDEPTIKALFIYNFTKHIEWPKGKINGKFVIGVVGNSPVFDKLIVILKERRIKDYPVEIRKTSSIDKLDSFDILFVSKGEGDRIREIDNNSDSYGVLIVTEERDMAKKGACINIIRQDERMKFEINESEIRKEGLKISTQLYELAVVVNKD